MDVERPEWATEYAVGDTIGFIIPGAGEVDTAPVAGFSSHDDHEGLPVIETSDAIEELYEGRDRPLPQSWVIEERHHVPPEELEDGDRDDP